MKYTLETWAKREGCEFKSPQKGDAGYDIAAAVNVTVSPGEQILVETGLRVKLPPGHVGIIKDRSGFSSRTDMHVFAGVIDERYCGPSDFVKVLIKNLSANPVRIISGQRIAQMIVVEPYTKEAIEGDWDEEQNRQGFGSTDLTDEEKDLMNERLA